MGSPVWGFPGDQWILEIHHTQTGYFPPLAGAGYNGGDALEHIGTSGDSARIYWEMTDQLSVGTSNPFPSTTELYTIEWFVPTQGAIDWQPIESQFHGSASETFPYDPSIPWAGVDGTSHQYIKADGGTRGTWAAAGPGPHTPEGSAYNAGGYNGTLMWLTSGSWLYAKWDFPFNIDHTWSALRLTQITPVTITSISRSGTTINVTWVAISGRTYQLQSKTDLTQATWNNVGGTLTATGNTATAPDTIGANTRHFYRVVLLP